MSNTFRQNRLSACNDNAAYAMRPADNFDWHRPVMDDLPTQAPVPAGWLESFARSKAQIAVGQTVPLLPILDRLRASAERLEAEMGVDDEGVPFASVVGRTLNGCERTNRRA